jgi:hypothetical protein
MRPSKGIIKIRAKSNWKTQIDVTTGEILKTVCRHSDIIEPLHNASYWQNSAKLWFTSPITVVLLLITTTGIILFSMLYYRYYNNRKRLKDIDLIA